MYYFGDMKNMYNRRDRIENSDSRYDRSHVKDGSEIGSQRKGVKQYGNKVRFVRQFR